MVMMMIIIIIIEGPKIMENHIFSSTVGITWFERVVRADVNMAGSPWWCGTGEP